MPTVKPIPEGYPRVMPHLSIAGAAEAIDFYKTVFGANERMRMAMPDGTIAHAEIAIGDSIIMIGDENAGSDPSPKTASTATAPRRSSIRSATAGTSPPTSRTCPPTRWRSGRRRR